MAVVGSLVLDAPGQATLVVRPAGQNYSVKVVPQKVETPRTKHAEVGPLDECTLPVIVQRRLRVLP